jgi:starch phosphorylase
MSKPVAYFSMEIAIDPAIPSYSGGLGVLAGDTIRAAADLGVPMVAITLLHRKGYVRQTLNDQGEQMESPEQWEPEQSLARCKPIVDVPVHGRIIRCQAWKRLEVGVTGHAVPIFFLDTDVTENTPQDRRITDSLYGGDSALRLLQELVLGVGGGRMLEALGYPADTIYHMNEGHAAFLLLDRIPESGGADTEGLIQLLRQRTVFTTHTPVPAGHDVFTVDDINRTLTPEHAKRASCVFHDGHLNMTRLAMRFAGTINAVSRKHMDVTKAMFPDAEVLGITNGVHAVRWTSPPFAKLFDSFLPGWRERSEQLRQAMLIPVEDIQQAHRETRESLLKMIETKYGMPFGGAGIVIGFARRATEYKRPLLIFNDLGRLKNLAERFGPINLLFAGKAHPRDDWGKQLIRAIHELGSKGGDLVRVAFLPNYDVGLAAHLVAGVDLWLNTPRAPLEASGTSGMKCALNGVPSLSVADGWWLEGGVQGVTGWTVRSGLNEGGVPPMEQDHADAQELYAQLEHHVLPTFFNNPGAYGDVMRNAIALNGSFFNTHRMVDQYRVMAYERFTLAHELGDARRGGA